MNLGKYSQWSRDWRDLVLYLLFHRGYLALFGEILVIKTQKKKVPLRSPWLSSSSFFQFHYKSFTYVLSFYLLICLNFSTFLQLKGFLEKSKVEFDSS